MLGCEAVSYGYTDALDSVYWSNSLSCCRQ